MVLTRFRSPDKLSPRGCFDLYPKAGPYRRRDIRSLIRQRGGLSGRKYLESPLACTGFALKRGVGILPETKAMACYIRLRSVQRPTDYARGPLLR